MIFEDLHWIDPTSLEVVKRSVDQIAALSALLIVTFRPEFVPSWAGRSQVTSITLNRLGERDAAAIVASLAGNKELPADVLAEIVERTDGIPLFVEEMTKAALEAETETDARNTTTAVPSSSVAVPASLHASFMARLDRLGPAKEVAQIAAPRGCHAAPLRHALPAAGFAHACTGPGSVQNRRTQSAPAAWRYWPQWGGAHGLRYRSPALTHNGVRLRARSRLWIVRLAVRHPSPPRPRSSPFGFGRSFAVPIPRCPPHGLPA